MANNLLHSGGRIFTYYTMGGEGPREIPRAQGTQTAGGGGLWGPNGEIRGH